MPRPAVGIHHRQGLRKKLSGHGLETAIRSAANCHAQSPERPRVTIFRPSFIEPAPIKTQMIVKAPAFGVECVVQKGGIRCCQPAQPVRFLFHFLELYRQDEGAGIIIRAVTFRKIRDGQDRVLEQAG